MIANIGPKTLACLHIAYISKSSSGLWRRAYDSACNQFSEKAIIRKFEELVRRGYIECGVSSRTGWLTAKGKAVLASSLVLY